MPLRYLDLRLVWGGLFGPAKSRDACGASQAPASEEWAVRAGQTLVLKATEVPRVKPSEEWGVQAGQVP